MTFGPIDFAALAAALLSRAETLVPSWLPGGRRQGAEWVCGGLDGEAGRSLSVNLRTGAWADFAHDEDRGTDLISLYAAIHGMGMGEAARHLMDMLGWTQTWSAGVQASAPAPAPASASSGPAAAPDADAQRQPVDGGGEKSPWKPIVPVPDDAPTPHLKHYHYGPPAASWAYRFEGALYGYVARYVKSDGGKEIVPWTWCVDESDGRGTRRWHQKQWPVPRPLYVPAERLAVDPALVPVVLVEGEKCADAGHQLLSAEMDWVSWPGGSNGWAKADWSWLRGRVVYLWPDADAKHERLTPEERKAGVEQATKPLLPERKQPGMKAMIGIGSLLAAEYGCTVALCPVPKPGAVSDGWDVADAVASGWDAEQVRAFVRGARPFVPPDEAARAAAAGHQAEREASAAGPDAEPDVHAWRKHLLLSDKGAIKAVRENIVLALDGLPSKGVAGVPEAEGLIAFNGFTNNVNKTRPSPWGTPAGEWGEADELLMGEWLVREHYLPSMARGTLEEATVMVADRHRYHPAREEIEACRGKWDGEKRLGTWLVRACMPVEPELSEDDRKYLARAGTWFVMGLCARVMTPDGPGKEPRVGPGCKFDYMLVLEGGQGWRKSTLAEVLGGGHYADTGLDLSNKDSFQNLQGVHVYEWGEMDSLNKSEITKVKNFVSSKSDRFRASFDRRPRDYPRQVVFVGTTNEDHYLSDPTGNRRFWPVRCTGPVDIDWVVRVRQQLIAEALCYLDAGERFHPTAAEQRDLFDPQQRERAIENAIEGAFHHYLYDDDQKVPHGGLNGALLDEVKLTDLLQAIGYPIDKQTAQVIKQAGAAMKRMGWPTRRTSEIGRPRVYLRPKASATKAASAPSRAGASHSNEPPQAHSVEETANVCPF